MEDCTVCLGTKVYINSRGVVSNQPCNLCDPLGFDTYLHENNLIRDDHNCLIYVIRAAERK